MVSKALEEFLVEHDFNPEDPGRANNKWEYPIFKAISLKRHDLITEMIPLVDLNTPSDMEPLDLGDGKKEGRLTPLALACFLNDRETVKLLLKHPSIKLGATQIGCPRPIEIAAHHGHQEIVKMLIEAGENLENAMPPSSEHLSAVFNSLYLKIKEGLEEATSTNTHLRVLLGEIHGNWRSFYIKVMIFLIAHQLKIKHILMEYDDERLKELYLNADSPDLELTEKFELCYLDLIKSLNMTEILVDDFPFPEDSHVTTCIHERSQRMSENSNKIKQHALFEVGYSHMQHIVERYPLTSTTLVSFNVMGEVGFDAGSSEPDNIFVYISDKVLPVYIVGNVLGLTMTGVIKQIREISEQYFSKLSSDIKQKHNKYNFDRKIPSPKLISGQIPTVYYASPMPIDSNNKNIFGTSIRDVALISSANLVEGYAFSVNVKKGLGRHNPVVITLNLYGGKDMEDALTTLYGAQKYQHNEERGSVTLTYNGYLYTLNGLFFKEISFHKGMEYVSLADINDSLIKKGPIDRRYEVDTLIKQGLTLNWSPLSEYDHYKQLKTEIIRVLGFTSGFGQYTGKFGNTITDYLCSNPEEHDLRIKP